jgi:hypothetical protein
MALKDLVITGKITREAAVERSTNPKLFEAAVPGGAPAAAGSQANPGAPPPSAAMAARNG